MDVVYGNLCLFGFGMCLFGVVFVGFFGQGWYWYVDGGVGGGWVEFQVGGYDGFFDCLDYVFVEYGQGQGMGVFYGDVGDLVQWCIGFVIGNYYVIQDVWMCVIGMNFCEGMVQCFQGFVYVFLCFFFDFVDYF